jgi:hypothetical protein
MSPEQSRGDPVSESSDLYSLGCLLYALLTGGPPFRSGDILAKHRNRMPLEPQARCTDAIIPDDLNKLVMDLLEKRPGNRPASATAVRESLAHIRETAVNREPGLDVNAPPEEPPVVDLQYQSSHEAVPGQWYEVTGPSLITGLGTFGLLFGAGAVGTVPSVVWGTVFAATLFVVGAVANWMSADADTELAWGCLSVLGWVASLVGCIWLMAARGDFPWYYDFLIGLGLSVVVAVLAFVAVAMGDEWGWTTGAGTLALLSSVPLTELGAALFAAHLHFVWWTTVLTGLGLWAGTLTLTAVAYEVAHH